MTRHDGPQILDRFGSVTDAARADLERFVALVGAWQRTHNLVARSTLGEVWSRHVADSLQLLEHAVGQQASAGIPPPSQMGEGDHAQHGGGGGRLLGAVGSPPPPPSAVPLPRSAGEEPAAPPDARGLAPAFRKWVDLGSGAGFPGLVVAIACKADPERRFVLVESNSKKAAFLRTAIRETGANAVVAAERIEHHAAAHGGADIVSARALAPLAELLPLAAPYLRQDSVMLLLKGQDFVHEIEAASKSWDFDVVDFPSVTDPSGRVLAIRHPVPKRPDP